MTASGHRGFTIIELLMTVVIIATGLVGIMALFENATKGALQADLNVVASNLAHEKLEQIVLNKWYAGYDSITQSAYQDETFTGDFSIYTRNTTVVEVSSSNFLTPEENSGYKKVLVTVRWGQAASQKVAIPTVLARY